MVHVHVAKKVQREAAGMCAHFCPFCRRITLFGVSNLSTVLTVNGIPVGKAKPVGDELTCRGCGVAAQCSTGAARPVSNDTEVDGDDLAALAEMAELSSPWDMDRLMERLDLEARLQSGSISAGERAAMIAEPFDAAEYQTTLLAAKGLSKVGGLLTAGFIIGLIAAAILWSIVIAPPGGSWIMWSVAIAVSIATLAIFPVLVRCIGREGRDARRTMVIDPLARSLASIGPTAEEVCAELLRCKRANMQLGARIRERELLNAMGIARAAPGDDAR